MTTTARMPAPPFDRRLIADFHAGLLPPSVADHIRRHLDDDPHAVDVLAALARVRTELAALGREPDPDVPPHIEARLDRLVDELTDS
ncbi:hypothetical protein [Gordonia shandongensis]|uniref:hypothetical protein n=1 Tax=Gordonia shandongensis TaxID=376351 RepID=UPI00047D2134|nr:hypothetical protein [Gordonia shandongensis]